MTSLRERHLAPESAGDPDLKDSTMLFIRHDRHPSGRAVDLVAPNAIRPASYKVRVPGDAPAYGAHTRHLLEGAGFDEEEISRMLADGSVSETWTYQGEYLPD